MFVGVWVCAQGNALTSVVVNAIGQKVLRNAIGGELREQVRLLRHEHGLLMLLLLMVVMCLWRRLWRRSRHLLLLLLLLLRKGKRAGINQQKQK